MKRWLFIWAGLLRYTDGSVGTQWHRNRWFSWRLRFRKPIHIDLAKPSVRYGDLTRKGT